MLTTSVKSIQGKRDYMEDRYVYLERKGITIAFVCDGHGGYQVAELVKRILPDILYSYIDQFKPHYSNLIKAKLIRKALLYVGKYLYEPTNSSGTTLTGIVADKTSVFIFNIGDSRTCFKTHGKTIYFLDPVFTSGGFIDEVRVKPINPDLFCTFDHDATNTTEVKRIYAAGGKIVGERLNGTLSVTRTIGDYDIKPGLSFVPDIFWTDRNNVAGPILLYSDGIYEPERIGKSNFDKNAIYYIGSQYGSIGLVNYAYLNGSEDNLTVLSVRL